MARKPMFKRPDYRILFVSQTAREAAPYLDPSTRYRCFNPAEVFSRRGVVADVIAQRQLTTAVTENYDAFVFHRPYGGDPNLVTCLDAIRKRGCPTIADYDDLVFDLDHALESSIFLNGIRSEAQTRTIFANNYLGLIQFDRFTVSTEPLARHVRKCRPTAEVSVIRNGLSRSLCESFERHVDLDRKRRSGLKPISYFSGTASHNPDFASVTEPLATFLSRHPDFRVLVAGPLDLPPSFAPGTVLRLPHREYREFFASAGLAYFNLAPLMEGNAFNACKSGLKFFESAFWGVPTAASPLEDFQRFADCPAMRLAGTPEEWTAVFERWATDKWIDDAQSAQDYCLEHCLADEPADVLLGLLAERR